MCSKKDLKAEKAAAHIYKAYFGIYEGGKL